MTQKYHHKDRKDTMRWTNKELGELTCLICGERKLVSQHGGKKHPNGTYFCVNNCVGPEPKVEPQVEPKVEDEGGAKNE